MNRTCTVRSLLLIVVLSIVTACGKDSGSTSTVALDAKNLNLIFVTSPDLAYHAEGDVNPDTANLTSQGLQRSLKMASFLKKQVLGGGNVNGIYALSPMTHLQTANNYPDMASIGSIQQFALLNKSTFSNYTGNSFPINVSYAEGSVPDGVSVPVPGPYWSAEYASTSTGLDFNNTNGSNDALISGIISNNTSGFHVFSAPWETISALMATVNTKQGYNLKLPETFQGPDHVYAISITSSGKARLDTYNANLNPPATFPALPSPVASSACTHTQQAYFKTVLTGGVGDVHIPPNANTNQRVYIVRHADAHPDPAYKFEDGNYVAAGQWRALALSKTLRGKISPNVVYSIDPAQWFPVSQALDVSYVRPSLTVLPYAIDNNLPYHLVSHFQLGVIALDETVAKTTSGFFFTGGKFSNQTMLLAWESGHIRPLLNALISTYSATAPLLSTAKTSTVPSGGWPSTDYDTIWTVSLDAQGNLTVDNELCEGIDSTKLPATAPQF